MAWIISYLIALLLLAFDIICIHSKNRISILGRIFIFFVPLANIAFETCWLLCKLIADFPYEDGMLNNNKITRWLFNGTRESIFHHN